MTKKSHARQMRDAQKKQAEEISKDLKNNRCWDELTPIYNNCVHLLHSHAHLSDLAQRKDLIECVADPKTLAINIRQLGADLVTLTGELKQIYAQHEGKSGGAETGDDVLASLQIAEQYHLFMERHQGVVMPTVYYIIEQFDQAEKVLAYKNAIADFQRRGASANPADGDSWYEDATKTYYKWENQFWVAQPGVGEITDVEIVQDAG